MALTLFGQPLLHGKWYIADEFGQRVPITISQVTEEREKCFYADNHPLFRSANEVIITGRICRAPITIMKKYDPIKKVIFNDPATIVIWKDGTKTIVQCQEGDTYSKELGLAMCFAKKFLGNKGNFNDTFKKYTEEK